MFWLINLPNYYFKYVFRLFDASTSQIYLALNYVTNHYRDISSQRFRVKKSIKQLSHQILKSDKDYKGIIDVVTFPVVVNICTQFHPNMRLCGVIDRVICHRMTHVLALAGREIGVLPLILTL